MPAQVRAADGPGDLWRCHECGWTYPNHHPSANTRRIHKKQCGKLPGVMESADLKLAPQVVTGSSDDGSPEGGHHHLSQAHGKNAHHQELSQSSSPAAASNIEQVCPSGSDPTPSNGGRAKVTPKIQEETASKVQVAETCHVSDQCRRSLGSAHAVKGQWSCRRCGRAYPNAHPSAKSRRKHKKICGVAAEHSLPGGSSDEASSDEEKICRNESNELAETQDPLKCNASVPQESLGAETIDEVSSKDIDSQFEGHVEGREVTDIAQEFPLESDSSSSQVPHDATSIYGVCESNREEKLGLGDSRVPTVDDGKIQPTEQEPAAPDTNDSPVPLTDNINSNQSQVLGKIRNRTVPKELKPSELDGAVIDQQPLEVSIEQVEKRKPDPSQPSQQNFAWENGNKSTNDLKKGDSESCPSQSHVVLGTDSLGDSVWSAQPDMKNRQPKPAGGAATGGESPSNFAARSPPESPEGLVRSRVQIFEKLAGATAPYLQKSVSPTPNSASPRPSRSNNLLNNGTTDTKSAAGDSNGPPKHLQETISHLRPQQSNECTAQPAPNQDAWSELQEVMSNLRHRLNFVQSECNEVPVKRT